MKIISASHRTIFKPTNSVFQYFAWPTVTRLPDGTLAIVASGNRLQHVCPFGQCIISYSRDEGETWTPFAPVINTPLDDRDGGIAVFGNRVIVTSFNNSVEFQRTTCKTWTGTPRAKLIEAYLNLLPPDAEQLLGSTYTISEDGGYTFGPVQIAPVSASHGPFAAPDGTLYYVGRVVTNGNFEDKVACYRLNENDRFTFLSEIEPIFADGDMLTACEPSGIVLPGGRILVHIRAQRIGTASYYGGDGIFTIYQTHSDDGGKTFVKPYEIGLPHGAPSYIMRHSSGVLIASVSHRIPPLGQRILISRDDGETWETDYVLRDDGQACHDLGYPSTVALSDGSLLTVYYQEGILQQSKWRLDDYTEMP